MFSVPCPTHDAEVLVPTTRIRGLRNTAHGIEVEIECWCGTTLVVHTGRRLSEPARAAAPLSR